MMKQYKLKVDETGEGYRLLGDGLPFKGTFYHSDWDAITFAKSQSPSGCRIEFLNKWGELLRTEEFTSN